MIEFGHCRDVSANCAAIGACAKQEHSSHGLSVGRQHKWAMFTELKREGKNGEEVRKLDAVTGGSYPQPHGD